MTDEPNLGNLAQAARGNQLSSARWTMIVIGIITFAVNGFFFLNARESVVAEIASLKRQGMRIDQSKVEDVVMLQKLVTGGAAGLGIVFIVLGVLVYKFPVPCTGAGLALYILSAIIFAAINPAFLVQGIIVKIIIVLGLFKSVKSALAYQAEIKAQSNNLNAGGFSIN